MAAADITIIESPATIEGDTTGAIITKSTAFPQMSGFLRNHGPSDVYCLVSVTTAAAVLANVATTGAQAQLQVPLPVGGVLPWLKHYGSIAHKCKAGTAVMSWIPDHNARRQG